MKFLCASLFMLLSFQVMPQSWLDNLNTMPEGENRFVALQKSFQDWSEINNTDSIRGWKFFSRWEWFFKQRLYPEFKMSDGRMMLKIFNETKQLSNERSKGAANWVSVSPGMVPVCSDTTNITGMGRIICISFHPTDTQTMFIGASQGGIWKTTDEGQNWVSLGDELPMLRVSDIAIDPHFPDTMYLATGDIDHVVMSLVSPGGAYEYGMGVLKSFDGGQTWDTTGLMFDASAGEKSILRKVVIHPDSAGFLLTGGTPGIWRSEDYGVTWNQTLSGYYTDIEVNPEQPNTIYATGIYVPGVINSRAAIYKSTNFGLTWTELATTIPPTGTVYRTEMAIAPSDTNRLYAISCRSNGGFFGFYSSSDAGQTWSQVASYTGTNIAPNMLGWADGGYFGFTLPGQPSDDAGQGTYDLTLLVHPSNPELIYSGGVNMWASQNGGLGGDSSTWNVVSFWLKYFGRSIHADQHVSAFHPITGRFYQATDGGLYITDTLVIGNLDEVLPCIDLGSFSIIPGCYNLETQWQDISHGLHITEYYRLGLCPSDPDMIIGGTQDNGTFLYRNGTWIQTLGGDGMEAMIDYSNPDVMYATNYSGALSRSDDGGFTYISSLEAPITGAGETGDWVTPFAMHPWYPNEIFAAFNNVWKSTDQGATWTQLGDIGTSVSLNTLTISPTSPEYIYTSRPDNIFRTSDAGQTWTSVKSNLPMSEAYLTYICTDYHHAQKAYVTFSGFRNGKKVYRTLNGGVSWENISFNLPNVPFNTIVHQAGVNAAGDTINGLYAGSDIGVFYTNDSLLQTPDPWIFFNTGMPAVVVNELEINYAAQKIVAATYGRGIWESPLFSPSFDVNVGFNQTAEPRINVFPNPGNGTFNVRFDSPGNSDLKWKCLSAEGRVVAQGQLPSSMGSDEWTIQLSDPAAGIYILHISQGNSEYRTLITVQ